jgi:hypothetical protein
LVLLAALPARAPAGAQELPPNAPAGVPLEAWRLTMRRDSFNVTIRGTVVGAQVTELQAEEGALVYTEHTEIDVLGLIQDTRVVMDRVTLAPRAVDQTGRAEEQQADTHVTIAGGRARGRAQTPRPGGQVRITDVDTTIAPATLDVNQLPMVLSALPLADSASFTASVFNAADASTTPYSITVQGVEDVTVPAGTFSTYRVLLGRAAQPQLTVFVTRQDPWRIVKLEAVGQPIAFELVRG